jgi:hypothetical protein
MTENALQLWADDTNSQFAIFLKDSHYVVKTDQNSVYTKIVDESPCLEGFSYDWKYTLSHWVSYFFGNQVVINNFLIPDVQPQAKNQNKEKSKEYLKVPRPYISKAPKLKPELITKPKLLKCRFCNLKYSVEGEREDHEKFWHSEQFRELI